MTKSIIEKATKLATNLHEWQKRKSWWDYINHPLAVMEILNKYDFPNEVLVAAILHDTCEDTEITNLYLRKEFWDRVGFIVNALTKNKKPENNEELKKKFEEEKKRWWKHWTLKEYIDYRFLLYINRFYVWIIAEPWIMFIKMADQIHNLETIDCFHKEKIDRKISEIENHFIPMYKKAKELVTPMYMPKYEWLMWELLEWVKKAKKL